LFGGGAGLGERVDVAGGGNIVAVFVIVSGRLNGVSAADGGLQCSNRIQF
jgi:hypothetical protein